MLKTSLLTLVTENKLFCEAMLEGYEVLIMIDIYMLISWTAR